MKINWKNKQIARLSVKSKNLRTFLFESGSLTRLIQEKCMGRFDINLINESWAKALPYEMHLLSLRNYEISFIRESYLSCNKKKLVYARTIIPRRTLNRNNEKLTKLGHKPLGEILFKNNQTHRKNVKYGKISIMNEPHIEALLKEKILDDLFVRQSMFYIDDRPLLVVEFFLPAIVKYSQ